MTYSDVIILRLTQLCDEKNITINRLATLFGASCIGNPCFLITSAITSYPHLDHTSLSHTP